MDDREHVEASLRWKAGQIVVCGDDAKPISHVLRSVHVVVVCSCECAFQSTDAGIAFGMFERHREAAHTDREASRAESPTASRPLRPECP